MSASLVGSEMCIRDSCCPPESSSGSVGLFGCVVVQRAQRAFWRATQSPCLLYTSDAADDM
eukprot:7600942-Alexandrium_andersonii.AAC.1